MPEYTIEAVAKEVKDFSGKYGAMKSYKVKLPGVNDPVEIVQKATTPAPQAGDTLKGTIESSQYGPKFKKDFQKDSSGKGRRDDDPFTMYLSYAKDIAIAAIITGKFKPEMFAEMLEAVAAGGTQLYEARPGAKDKVEVKQEPLPEPPEDEAEMDWGDTIE